MRYVATLLQIFSLGKNPTRKVNKEPIGSFKRKSVEIQMTESKSDDPGVHTETTN